MSLAGLKIALTGKPKDMTRADFKTFIAEAGAEYSLSLDDVEYLVLGDKPVSSKVEKAKAEEIEILDWEEFQAKLRSPDTPGETAEVPLAYEHQEEMPHPLEILDGGRRIRILDVSLRRYLAPRPLTPPMSQFSHYTLDVPTLAQLRFISRAISLRQPCLLEGDTATSKTSAILYLAALSNHEVVRINLNGQSDTSELVGRYIPNEEEASVPVDDLMEHLDLLEDESRRILEAAKSENRSLSKVELQQVAVNEGIRASQWRFHEGLVPQAMRHGWWVILDEVNLAEPAVLERLNSVLERQPSLVLTEGTGTRFGVGGDVPVHPDFRIFATMNPAEYQGRSVLSPAYKDRWVATWQAHSPGEIEYRQMLERVVFGRHPDVLVDTMRFKGREDQDAPYGNLKLVPAIREFLARLAALHAGLVRMALSTDGKPAALGTTRRERYVFSRRALLAVLDALANLTLCDPHTGKELTFVDAPEAVAADTIERVYLDRIRGSEDRKQVTNLLASLGLQRGNWLHQFSEDKKKDA